MALTLMLATPASAGRLFEQPFLHADPHRLDAVSISGDVNGNGYTDLIMFAGSAFVANGDGAGTFTPGQSFPFGIDAALGDVNGDTHPDLLNPGTVKLNNGDGTFGPELALSGGGTRIQLRDLNGDGHLDMVYVDTGIRARLGNGDGTFGAFTFPFTTAGTPTGLTMADVNADGKSDAVVTCGGSKVSVLLGTGNASLFQPKVDLTTGGEPQSAAVGDVNEDGAADLAVMVPSPGAAYIHLGNGSGTFGAGTALTTPSPHYATFADFDQDGHVDLACTGGSLSSAEVFRGNGDGTFGARQSWDLRASGARSLEAVHADNDATWDLLCGNGLLLGNGDGTFGRVRKATTGTSPRSVAIGDLNGDGAQDVVVGNNGSASVTVAFGNGDGTLGATSSHTTDTSPVAIQVGDFNQDGRLDIVTANDSPGSLSILLALPGGGFGPKSDISLTSPWPTDIRIADLNADGKIDLVVGRRRATSIFNHLGQITVYLGVGDGTFSFYSHYTPPGPVLGVEIVDMDGDGIKDLVLATANSGGANCGSITIMRGDGTGGFVLGPTYEMSCGGVTAAMAVADMNLDGNLDVVRRSSLFLGNGDGTLQSTPLSIPVFGAPVHWVSAEFKGDGNPDLVATVATDWTAEVLYGNGNATFTNPEYLGVLFADAVAVGQMTPDTRPELVMTSSLKTVTVLLNTLAPVNVSDPGPVAASLSLWGRPNPARSRYQVSFQLPRATATAVSILDATGRRVRTLHQGALAAGSHTMTWDLRDRKGRPVGAGLYWCRLQAGDEISGKRFAVLR